MKKYILLLLLLAGFSCKKEIGNDPNTAGDVPLRLMLPSAQTSFALLHGTEISWYAAVFMQQQAGVDRQMVSVDRYDVHDNELNRPWNLAYADCLNDLKQIISKGEREESWAYAGIAKILSAAALGQLTDTWGNVPWSQALQGTDNLSPAYDEQQAIYAAIQQLLTDGITDLGKTSAAIPSSDDYFYGGDESAWIATANILRARYYNHLSSIDPQGSAVQTLAAIDEGIYPDNSLDLEARFGLAQTEANPWYQFIYQRGDVRMGKFMVDLMDTMNDPRLPLFAAIDGNGGYSGSPAGNADLGASLTGMIFDSPDDNLAIITFVEAKFIEAEAALRSGNSARAAQAHNEAVLASLQKHGAADAVFESTFASETAGSITLEKIMLQKYVALFLQSEVWTDWRRTGFPQLSPAANNYTGGLLPRRLIYPHDERTFNSNVPAGGTVLDRVWWNQ